MSQIEDIIAKAWDAEEAAQMGEPSPWKVGPFGLDPDWTSGRHACATAAIRALEAAGFAIVPTEPTLRMIEATYDLDIYWHYQSDGRPGAPEDAYCAMLAAAGEPK